MVTITSVATGTASNYALSASSSSSDPAHFPTPSFTMAPSGATLTGGANAVVQSTNTYSYSITKSDGTSGYAGNGDILNASDLVNGNWAYTYDDMNRLLTAVQGNNVQSFSYDYDRYGNRWHQNGPLNSLLSFTGTNNRIDGPAPGCTATQAFCCDASGNLLNDGTPNMGAHSYFYDAENRLIQVDGTLGTCSTATACYIYDADGKRVRKTVGGVSKDYLYDLAGNEIDEISSTSTLLRGEVYGGVAISRRTAAAPPISYIRIGSEPKECALAYRGLRLKRASACRSVTDKAALVVIPAQCISPAKNGMPNPASTTLVPGTTQVRWDASCPPIRWVDILKILKP